MKKLLYNIAILLSAVALTSCVYDNFDVPSVGSDTEGVATISFNMPEFVTRAALQDTRWANDCDIRVYKVSGSTEELIRHYFSLSEMPQQLWLLAGTYKIKVVCGEQKTKTWSSDELYFKGESADFTITAGNQTAVSVECNIVNTIVEVAFDSSIADNFNAGYKTIVTVADEFNKAQIDENGDYTLVYDASHTRGYFILPLNANNFAFGFSGTVTASGSNFEKSFVRAIDPDKKEGYLYKVTLKYTPSEVVTEGYLSWDFDLSYQNPEGDDVISKPYPVDPSQKPSMSWGDDTAISVPKMVEEDGLSYKIVSSQADITSIKIEGGKQTYTIDLSSIGLTRAATAYPEIEVEGTPRNLTVILKPAFFDGMASGDNVLNFTITDQNDRETTAKSAIMIAGLATIEMNEWKATATAKAYAKADGNVQIKYRVKNTQSWSDAEMSSDGVNYTGVWTIAPDTQYEYQLYIDGSASGDIRAEKTSEGAQVYNFDFENWGGTAGSRTDPRRPYIDINTDQWWDCGNEGSKIVGMTLTQEDGDKRPGSQGNYSAKLASSSTLGVLATGNLFLGKFVGTHSTTKGVVAFGKPFTFTFAPKELQFWFKSTVGNIDTGSGAPGVSKGDKDTQQIYVLLCNMPGPHIVDTGDTSSFLNVTNGIKEISYFNGPVSDIVAGDANKRKNNATGHVIAWGVFENQESINSWTLKTIQLNYNEEYSDEQPTWLMITAAANKYGDYYMGCKGNVMYLDDMEFVY